MGERNEMISRLGILEEKIAEINRRIEEIGMQIEAINKALICLYRYGDFSRCSVIIRCAD
ncbi:hypothetical protein DRO37_04625 [Candidatus Bathyarchaeota archaeon]|nr:MAG: hypothetical protein DRO37_04625 [Candidatus Bathyarchaeota archaeon]